VASWAATAVTVSVLPLILASQELPHSDDCRPSGLVGAMMLETAWACPRAGRWWCRSRPRARCRNRTPSQSHLPPEVASVGSSDELSSPPRFRHWHRGGRRDHPGQSPAPAASPIAAARWLSGANTYSAIPRPRRRHAQPCQQPGARDRRADQRRLAGPISPTASQSPIRSRADAFLQVGPWRRYGKRRRAGKRVTLRHRARHWHVGRDRDQCQRIFHRRDRHPGSITGAGKPRPIAAAC
jgi:hypothetical protein